MKKRLLSILLALCMTLALLPGMALADSMGDPYPATGGDVYIWAEDSEYGHYASITYCEKSVTELIIPGEYKGQPMSYIEGGAFTGCSNLVSLTIPASVTRIYMDAFRDCVNLKDVYYTGSESQWKQIIIDESNEPLLKAAIHYNSTGSGAVTTPAPAAQAVTAIPTASAVQVNGSDVAFDAYNINGNNYFKLRDLAYVLSGTAKQFEVSWDASTNAITLTAGQPYTAVGGEMAGKGAGNQAAQSTTSKIFLNGQEVSLTAYNINGNNYFKLRDVGEAFDFGVDWDGASQTVIIDTAKGYSPD